MHSRNFFELINNEWEAGLFACVGLDSDMKKIPTAALIKEKSPWHEQLCPGPTLRYFSCSIVDATACFACAFKLNSAFYEAKGHDGIKALRDTVAYIHQKHPSKPVILDAKRADIGNTNTSYVEFAFEYVRADAITVHPYLGREALQPFFACKNKGIFVLCRTSNPGASEFQDQNVTLDPPPLSSQISRAAPTTAEDYSRLGQTLQRLYRVVARHVAEEWNSNGNCGLVVGATYPQELAVIRQSVGDLPILIPGIGAQGGDVEATVKAGMDSRRRGMIINSSRGIIFASTGDDYATAAGRAIQELHELINQFRTKGTTL